MGNLRLVVLSDTHGRHRDLEVPEADLLIHAGDFTRHGKEHEVAAFGAWLAQQPHAVKLVVPGNHDLLCQQDPERARELLPGARLLLGEGGHFAGLSVWGSPWQPWFKDWAFNLPRGPLLAEHWATAPADLDVLITHTPPAGVLDVTWRRQAVGCEDLTAALSRLRPRLHVFGHIHEARGRALLPTGGLALNACNLNLLYRPAHPVWLLEWDSTGPRVLSGG
jgi:Calcineurin-like phosphoesterase